MADGTKKEIASVRVNDMVLSFHPETLDVSTTRVVNRFVRKNDYPIYKLKTISGREIRATEDHKFMTNQGWKEVRNMMDDPNIKVGIYMMDYKDYGYNIINSGPILNMELFKTNIETYYNMVMDENVFAKYTHYLKSIYVLDLNPGNPKLNILARIVGHVFINKNACQIGDFQYSLKFQNKKDIETFIQDANKCGFLNIDIKQYLPNDDYYVLFENDFQRECFYALLISLGFQSIWKRRSSFEVPSWILNHKEYGLQFVRGLKSHSETWSSRNFDKNGKMENPMLDMIFTENVNLNSIITFSQQIKYILYKNKIECYELKPTQHDFFTISKIIISNENTNMINYYDNIGYAYNNEQNHSMFNMIEYVKCTKDAAEKMSWETWNATIIYKNNYAFIPILEITKIPDGFVSDIEVESENHSFISSYGFASSNCAMGKQAMGVYATNYDNRMDKTAYVLNYPTRPLVETRIMNLIHLNKIPSGCQIHVAIMTHTGYNQEDSVLINKGSLDRGLFLATIYHTEKDEDKNIIRDEIIRCKPDKTKTKGIKYGNYEKLNAHGFIPENTLVENRDVIIAKIVPIKENRNDPTKTIKYEDQSKTFRTIEETYIDKNFTGRNGDGYNFAKVRVRTLRKPVLGDKFSSRSGQKGTCGNIIPEWDMPFTKDGMRPDIILNPHAIPSRMTIAQLKETLLGKVLIELGLFGDATSFGNLDIKTISNELLKLGYESYGNEVLYNGLTGEQLESNIFIGPVFYQRLKHMVNDKQHSRSIGPMVNLTRQPAEGRSRDGGFRIGEMERDVMIAHGAAKFCRERLYEVSDKYSMHVCRKCGLIASYNDGNINKMYDNNDFTIHLCKTCNNTTDFARVEVPYSFKLMSQELQTINVVPRIIT
jgi:hypothetical protein